MNIVKMPHLLAEMTTPKYPKSVILESTNRCNLRCKMCHVWGENVSQKRDTGFISETIWEKAIDELSTWEDTINVALHGAGESLLHKDFIKILDYATSKENLSVGFLSNGTLLTPEMTNAILRTDISWIGFSVEGAEATKYKKYRGTDLNKVEAAIEHLLTLRKGNKPAIFVNMVALPDLDTEGFIRRWIDLLDEIRVSTYRPIGHRDFLTQEVERIPCSQLNEMLVIAWNGQAVLCCEDIWADMVIGRFPEQSMYDLWHSPSFEKARKLHKDGVYHAIPICANCDSWSNIFTATETKESDNLKIVKCASQTTYQRMQKIHHK